MVIYKLDDFGGLHSPSWRPLLDWAVQNGHAMAAGAMGRSFRNMTSAERDYVRGLAASGLVELWNHGFAHKFGEFHGAKVDDMARRMRRTNRIFAAVGIPLRAFGAPGNGADEATAAALDRVSGLKIWMLVRARSHLVALTRNKTALVLNSPPCWLEVTSGIMRPPGEVLPACLAQHQSRGGPLVLQAHPRTFDDVSMQRFKDVVTALRDRGYTSCTPSQYFGLA